VWPEYLAPLYEEWNPPFLLHRDKELRKILHFTIESPIPENLWIEGAKGLGKTLTCKFFAQEVKARNAGVVFYISCGPSFNQALKTAFEKEGVHIPMRMLSTYGAVSTLLKQLPSEKPYYFIIDDPEHVRDPRSIDDFVRDAYNILTWEGKKYAILIVTRISLKKAYSVYEVLKADSRLHPIPIIFQPYNAAEIAQILKQRLHYAFTRDDVYEEDALYVIAEHIYRVGSDVREALEILRYAVLKIAKEKLTRNDAEEAVEWAKKEWWKEKLLSLPPHWAFLAYIAAKSSRALEEGVTAVEAYNVVQQYKSKCDELRVDPLGKTTTYYALKKMGEAEGLFSIERVKIGGIYALRLMFDEDEAKRIEQAGEEIDWRWALLSRQRPPVR